MTWLLVIALVLNFVNNSRACDVRAQTTAGPVCGLVVHAGDKETAVFRAVPYAQQPLAELRFKELQPLEPWQGDFNATDEGPVCPQDDRLFGRLLRPRGMSEACIHANIAVPLPALPNCVECKNSHRKNATGLPILVFVHGGGYQSGSGDFLMNGYEYMIQENVIVMSFNYRLNVFGFLSLNSSSVPGNQALRDAITFLKWVQANAKYFGGNPDDVTLMGHSSGAANVHLLSLSTAAEGLFKRIILLSGTGLQTFYTTNPAYAKTVSSAFLTQLGINSTNVDDIHQQLINTPLDKIMEVNTNLQNTLGLATFTPVVESPFEGVTRILDDQPETLIKQGRGKDIPAIIGFTTGEMGFFEPVFTKLNLVNTIAANHTLLLPLRMLYSSLSGSTLSEYGDEIFNRYTNGTLTMETLVEATSDTYIVYPAMKLAQQRAAIGAKSYLYEFAYKGDYRVVPIALELEVDKVIHTEDLSYILRINSMYKSEYSEKEPDSKMKRWMTNIVHNYMLYSNPVGKDSTAWPAAKPGNLAYQEIETNKFRYISASDDRRNSYELLDRIWETVPY